MSAVKRERALVHLPATSVSAVASATRLVRLLDAEGFEVESAATIEELRVQVREERWDLLFTVAPSNLRDLSAVIRMGERDGLAVVFTSHEAGEGAHARLRPWPCACVSSPDSIVRAIATAYAARDAIARESSPSVVAALCEVAALANSSRPPRELISTIVSLCGEALSASAVGVQIAAGLEHRMRVPLELETGALKGPLALQAASTLEHTRAHYTQRGPGRSERFTAPICGPRELFGALAVEVRSQEPFGRGAMALVLACADLIAVQFERARVADVLEHRERLAMFGELMAAAAHEMSSPISYIRSNLTSLNRSLTNHGKALPADVRHDAFAMINDCLEGTERLGKMVGSLRAGARQPKAGGDLVDLAWVAQRASELVKSYGRSLETRLQLEPTPQVRGDYGRIQQVVINLLTNALHAISEGGGRLTIRTGTDGGRAFLEVEDNGPGVPPELAERIFDRFFTTKPVETGTGLGLSLSREIARDHRGDLQYRRAPSGGACFRLTLPCESAAMSANVEDA